MPQCRLSILRNCNVPCHYFLNVPVDFKLVQCRLSNLRKCYVALSNLRVKGPLYQKHKMDTSMLSTYHLKALVLSKCIRGIPQYYLDGLVGIRRVTSSSVGERGFKPLTGS